jgi:transposase
MRKRQHPAEMGFTPFDRRRLRKALGDTRDASTYQRLQAVLLVALGYAIDEIAQIVHCSRRSIYFWLQRYLGAHRIEDLQHQPGAGRPSVAADLTKVRLLRELRRNPLRLGYPTTVWTVALLARQVSQRYHCSITPRTLRRRMRQWGLVWKRARPVFANREPHLAQKKGPLSGS